MRRHLSGTARAAVLAAAFAAAAHGSSAQGPMSSTFAGGASAPPMPASAAGTPAPFDVEKLFAGTCGWCHSNAGRVAGRGPKLMDTTLTDAEIINRIKNGKPGAMPAFGSAFTDDQIRQIIVYIRNLKPDGASKP